MGVVEEHIHAFVVKRVQNPIDSLFSISYNLSSPMSRGEPVRGCTGFDGGHAAGEAIRMQCVKWQN